MNLNRLINDLARAAGIGGAEKRFARDLGRTLGPRISEPSHSEPTSSAQPAATPQPEPPETERNSAAFASGVDHGQAWGFNRAYLPDLQRLVEWVSTVRGNFSAQDVVAIVFPRPIGDWMRHDAAQLLAGDEDYARGFVVGAMLVWAHQLTKEPKGEKED